MAAPTPGMKIVRTNANDEFIIGQVKMNLIATAVDLGHFDQLFGEVYGFCFGL